MLRLAAAMVSARTFCRIDTWLSRMDRCLSLNCFVFCLGICDLTVIFFYSRIGPEKGVIHLATAAVNNALWDMFARARGKPLWKLIVDMTPVRDIVLRLSLSNSL